MDIADRSETACPGVVSFFAGCGILDLGFERAGFRTWLANELNPAFAEAYEYARTRMGSPLPASGAVVRASIADFFGGELRVRLEKAMDEARHARGSVGFIGGPPCPDFSIAGKQAGRAGDHGRLTQDYFDLIGIMRPDFFVFENVKGLFSTAKHREFFNEMVERARSDGYEIVYSLVNALWFGVPQDRHRVIVVGFHKQAFPFLSGLAAADGIPGLGDPALRRAERQPFWPSSDELPRDPATGEPVFREAPCPASVPEKFRPLTVQHWFSRNDVESHANQGDVFQVRQGLARMRQVPEGDTTKKSFKRLHRWRYSPTAAYGNNEVHLHPWLDRRLSVAEAMAMQSLPAEFVLPPAGMMTLSDKFKTIGNGVPYLLALGVAEMIRDRIGGRAAAPVSRDQSRGRTEIPEALPVPAVDPAPEAEQPFRSAAEAAELEAA